jgi:hypothetical protein
MKDILLLEYLAPIKPDFDPSKSVPNSGNSYRHDSGTLKEKPSHKLRGGGEHLLYLPKAQLSTRLVQVGQV